MDANNSAVEEGFTFIQSFIQEVTLEDRDGLD